jgi:dTDP-glucose 4,6-dehydratase
MVAVVAGGAGFIGSHLCDLLIARGFRVICLDNLITGSLRNVRHLRRDPRFGFRRIDVTRPFAVPGRVDVVYHLASPASPWDYFRLPLETLAVGAAGTRNLLELARQKKAVFVLASTSEVYGDPDEHPQRETYFGNVNPVGPRSCYDEAKRYAEALTMACHREYRLATRIARIFNTYGPRMKAGDGRVVPEMTVRALQGRPLKVFGTGRQTRSFCFVSDMVEGLFRMAACPDPMPVNLGNPREFTMLELARLLSRLVGRKVRLRHEPPLENDPKQRQPDIRRARRLLGWNPAVQFEEGLRETIDWFRKNLPGRARG